MADIEQFRIDYTFWLNFVFASITGVLIWLHRKHVRTSGGMEMNHELETSGPLKRLLAFFAIGVLIVGLALYLFR